MKKLILICLSVISFACNDRGRNSTTSEVADRDTISSKTQPPGNIQEERDAVQTEKEEPRIPVALDGRYRKIEEESAATTCNCNCIEINFEQATEWCIDKDKIYITARTQKTGENSADVYFQAVAREMAPDRKMPWQDFDTDTPVAKLTFTPNGGAELDWLGFSTNGEISTDYALFGKKTLEGTYKKE
ncbi:hypothetical protein [Salinimicrobium oceani]|uniref:Lipoprotein n=1 Tax=Salinimicrobium oceani TaxID=2722702 RepID=A0ABX1CWY8_9FLAO|nr:hypothetical protein [Salinimicrobium oceani]NJW51869.1 hypothetical protein [Salinimicrobium oceani]